MKHLNETATQRKKDDVQEATKCFQVQLGMHSLSTFGRFTDVAHYGSAGNLWHGRMLRVQWPNKADERMSRVEEKCGQVAAEEEDE
ncbi:hypothetical protein TYRP_000421 [Tyrophagus putrescentiae]|nr:hypothetical protein TYRP_000421 [Tyrophagus putrescentiae]